MKYTVRERVPNPQKMVCCEKSVLASAGSRDLILIPLSGLEGRSGADVELAVSAVAEGCS